MIGVERLDGLVPPMRADDYGFAVLLPEFARCEGGKRGDVRCRHHVRFALGVPPNGDVLGMIHDGVWAWACRVHARQYRGAIYGVERSPGARPSS